MRARVTHFRACAVGIDTDRDEFRVEAVRRRCLALLSGLSLLVQIGMPGAGVAWANDFKTTDSPRVFPSMASLQDWQARATQIHDQVLVSCGLWPTPQRPPLNARIFGKIERDGYSVEKVYFQTYPGFYLAGNLYRPLGKGVGPFPAVLNPHGHWADGRLTDTSQGSIPARCINFARQGMIAFSYDMVGYNDTQFAPSPNSQPGHNTHRQFATNQVNLLWNISIMGLQTWNSIRALDFLESLPDVDRHKLACTGESGGGTQTFMLGAVDNRLAAQAPVVMVSHSMQGGCVCENAPGLRVEYSNMEIAAAPAPRPQMLVAAAGDWTKDTLTIEGPSIEHVYNLFSAGDRFKYVRFDFGHNYNQTSREAVYGWFGKWLGNHAGAEPISEQSYRQESNAVLRVWSDQERPADALSEEAFIAALIESHRSRWRALIPHTTVGLEQYKLVFLPAWQHTLLVEWPRLTTEISWKRSSSLNTARSAQLEINHSDGSTRTSLIYLAPPVQRGTLPVPKHIVVLADSNGIGTYYDENGSPRGLARRLLSQGCALLILKNPEDPEPRDVMADFFTTYNRTEVQERVRDLITACAHARSLGAGSGRTRVVLCGAGRAGLWALLAAPAADEVVADGAQIDTDREQTFLTADLFCPGLLVIGGPEGAAMLAAPHPLLLYNTGSKFSTLALRQTYRAVRHEARFHQATERLTDEQIAHWILQVK